MGILLSLVLTAVACHGQQPSGKKLENQDVIDMVSLGLSDDVVIDKIHAADITEFDTDIAALKSLKAAKVSDAVIRVMIHPKEAPPASSASKSTAVAVNVDLNDPNAPMIPAFTCMETPEVASECLCWSRPSTRRASLVECSSLR